MVTGREASLVQGWKAVRQRDGYMEKQAKVSGTEGVGRSTRSASKWSSLGQGRVDGVHV